MIVKANLYISDRGNLRITKTDYTPRSDELAVRLSIDVPDSFWNRPTPRANLTIPNDFLSQPDNEMVVKFLAPELAESLKLEVRAVEDGLTAMLKEKLEK